MTLSEKSTKDFYYATCFTAVLDIQEDAWDCWSYMGVSANMGPVYRTPLARILITRTPLQKVRRIF